MVKFYELTSKGYVEIGSVSIVNGKIQISGSDFEINDHILNGGYIIEKAVAKLLPWDKDPNLLLDELVRRYYRGTYFNARKVEDT